MALDTIQSPQSTGKNGGDMSAYKYCRSRDGVVHLDVIVDGKRFRRSTGRPATPANLKYVDKNWQSEVERIKKKNEIEEIDTGEMTVGKYGYKSLAANRSRRKNTTNEDYLRAFELHIKPTWEDIALSKVLQTDIKAWQTHLKEDKKLCGSRIHVISVVLQGIMKDAIGDKLILSNPLDRIGGMSRKSVKEISPFTFDEVRYILSNAEGWFKNYLSVAFFTGMRTGELLALNWEDINMHSGKILVRRSMTRGRIGTTKTDQEREIDLLPPVLEALRDQFKISGLKGQTVFYTMQSQNGFTNSGSIVKTNWNPLLKKLMLGQRTLYQTRHTFATIMISKGEDITWVSQMMGHANSSITLTTYTKYREDKSVKRASFLEEADVYKVAPMVRERHESVTLGKCELSLKIS